MKEWYLIDRPSTTSGGYENEALNDYRDDAMYDMLETELASAVILHNYDLSESTEIRCIIQGNSADTQLKSMERIGLFVRGTVKAGMYIFYENRYWLITGYPSYNGIYEKAVMQLCQYKLRWQNAKGEIIERFGNFSSSSKYDMGETGNSTITLTSDNLMILLPNDDESLDLDGKRVFIDKREIDPTKVYKITRTDSVLYDFGEEHGGILSFIADKTELNTTTDRPDLRLCDYIDITTPTPPQPSTPDETAVLNATISGTSNLRIGVTRTYTATLFDKNCNAIQWDDTKYGWNVTSDFDVKQSVTENKISLTVEDEDFIDSSFLLQLIKLDDNSVIAEIEITVIEVI